MRQRMFVWMIAMLGAVPSIAGASGLLYRPASTGQWVGIYQGGDTRAVGFFAGQKFKSPAGSIKAPVASLPAFTCGAPPVSVAAFSAEFNVAGPPSTGIFLYDGVSDTIVDAVIEGAVTPAGGTYGKFKSGYPNPAIAINPGACVLHVFFRGQIGPPGPTNTALFDATFALPGFVPFPVALIAQESTTGAPPPFPGASTFGDFSDKLRLAATFDGAAIDLAFRGKVIGGGVPTSSDTGVFVFSIPGTFATAVMEGSVTCAPTWPGAGAVYDDFGDSMEIAIGAPAGPYVLHRAKSKGGPSATETALQFSPPLSCAFISLVASAGALVPDGAVGGTYTAFAGSTPLAMSSTGAAWLGKVSGGSTPKALFSAGGGFGAASHIVRQASGDSALGSGLVSITGTVAPAVNTLGKTVFRASVAGMANGLFAYSGGPAEVVSFAGSNPQIDDAGNMTARFP
ncbi:MAG: hypothetical protein HYR72_16985 [Deltaproteobacteria bacterium]|nr:hypothetical protein [Deltaproteobacteria bacterium]